MYIKQTKKKKKKNHLERNRRAFASPRGLSPNSSNPEATMCHTTQPPPFSFPRNFQDPSPTVIKITLCIKVMKRMKLGVGVVYQLGSKK